MQFGLLQSASSWKYVASMVHLATNQTEQVQRIKELMEMKFKKRIISREVCMKADTQRSIVGILKSFDMFF